jgi:2-dehydro-3-deoxygluconokinase
MKKFLTIGEPLVVFSSEDLNASLSNARNFTKHLAGAELNVAIGMARLGINSSYITSIGNDPFGQFIEKGIKDNGINNKYIYKIQNKESGFYLKQRVNEGDPEIYYYRRDSAASNFNSEVLDEIELNDSIGVIHCTGIMPAVSDNGYKAVEKLLNLANQKSICTVFDPNIRKQLWKDESLMKTRLNYLSSKAQIVIPGIQECKLLTGLNTPEEIANFYFNQSNITQTIIIKDGSKGAFIKERNKPLSFINSYKVRDVVDTVGAGDGFAVGLISGILENYSIETSVKRACAIGALAVQSAGDSDGYPTRNKLEEFMEKCKND